MAASDALRPNWDSKNLGPKVDMPAMRVASVAPAKQRKRKGGFFRRSSSDLQTVRLGLGTRYLVPVPLATAPGARIQQMTSACPWLIVQTEGPRRCCGSRRSAGGLQRPAWPQTPESLQTEGGVQLSPAPWPRSGTSPHHSLEFRRSRVPADPGPTR